MLGLQEEAKRERIAINVGIHEPTLAGKKVKNTSIWINEDGYIAQRYQKLHLFDVDIKDGPVLKESNSVEKGMNIVPPFETVIGRIGLVSTSLIISWLFTLHDTELDSREIPYALRNFRATELSKADSTMSLDNMLRCVSATQII